MSKEVYDFGNDAIIVARVSTNEQILNPNLSPQVNDLMNYAKSIGYENIKAFGTSESGFLIKDDKLGWNRVIEFITENPTYKTIIATEISRLGRDDEVLGHIKKFLLKNKIQLLIKDINFELFNRYGEIDPGKDIIFALYSSLASAEMRVKQERFKRAKREYRKIGYSIGGKRLFGYERVCDGNLGKKNKYIICEKEANEIRTIYSWYLNGIDGDLSITSTARIAYECKARGFSEYLYSKRNVNKCLKERAYVGFKITNNLMKNPQFFNYNNKSASKYIKADSYECLYPRILDDSLFYGVQEKLSKKNTHLLISNNTFVDKSRKHTTILAKLLFDPISKKNYVGEYRISGGYTKHTYRCDNCPTMSMIMLDSVIWSFIKTKVQEITSKIKQSQDRINIQNLNDEIGRLKDGFKDFDEQIETENTIFRTNMKISKNKQKLQDEYKANVKRISKQRNELERIIAEKERVLQIAQDRFSSEAELDEVINQNINRIENDKKEMYKYVHLLIKSIIPIFTNRKYTIIEVNICSNTDEALDYTSVNKDGTPVISGKKHDNMYYICINKHNANRIVSRVIVDNQIYFNSNINEFILGDKNYSLDYIFNINLSETNPANFMDLQHSVEDLPFNKLSFYNEDV